MQVTRVQAYPSGLDNMGVTIETWLTCIWADRGQVSKQSQVTRVVAYTSSLDKMEVTIGL